MQPAEIGPTGSATTAGYVRGGTAAESDSLSFKPRSFAWHIGMLSLGIIVPAFAFIIYLVMQFTASERARFEYEAQNMARTLAISLSREVNGVTNTLQALAANPSIASGDLGAFHAQASHLRGQQDLNFSLRDASGVTLSATRLPFGQQITTNPTEVIAADKVAISERRSHITDVFIGPVTGKPAVQIMVPVLSDEPARFVLGASLEPEFFHDILERFDRSVGWTAAIVDRQFVLASLKPGHQSFAGQRARTDFIAQATQARGFYYGVNSDGVAALVAYETDAGTGWKTLVSLPTALIDQQLRKSLLQIAAAGLMLGLLGLVLVTLINRRLYRAIEAVKAMAETIRLGRPVGTPAVAVTDIARIGQVMRDAAEEARFSLGQLRRVLDNLFTFVGILDLDGKVVEANAAPLAMAALDREAVIGVPFWATAWWRDMLDEQQRIEAACEAAKAGKTVRFDIDVRAAGGKIITIDFQITPLRDEAGRIVGLQPSGVDITARVKAQSALADREARSRFIAELRDRLDQARQPADVLECAATALSEHVEVDVVAIHEIDHVRGEVAVHSASSQAGIGNGVYPLDEVYAQITQAELKAGRVVSIADVRTDPITRDRAPIFESYGIRSCLAVPLMRQGRWVAALVLAHGNPHGWWKEVEFLPLVAERIWMSYETARLMRDLAASEERLQIGVAVAGLGLGRMDYAADAITLDAKAAELFALPADQPIPRADVHARFHPEDAPALLPQIASLVGQSGEGFMAVEHRVLRPDGTVIWLSARKQVIYETGQDGKRRAVSGILAAHDISARRMAEEALRQSEERLSLSQEAASVASWEWHPAEGKARFSANAKALWGFPDDWTFDMESWLDLIHPDDRRGVIEGLATVIDDPRLPYEAEFRVRRGDDGWRWLLGKGRALDDVPGHPRKIAGINMDITERKQLEDRQRLLMRELHHRVKNSLATVQAIANSSLRSASSMQEFRDAFASRLESLSRTHSLLTENIWSSIGLRELIEAELAPYAEGERMKLDGPSVRLPAQMALALGMAFHELATNAAKHGSLSSPAGRLDVLWGLTSDPDGQRLSITWREHGGPKAAPPTKSGFGTRLLSRILGPQIGGTTSIDFAATGVVFKIEAPLPPFDPEEFETARSDREAQAFGMMGH